MSTTFATNDSATPLEMVQRITNFIASAKSETLPQYTAPTRLSPIVLIDEHALSLDTDMTKAVLQTVLSIFASNYLRAITLEANIGNITVHRLLDKFATDRDIMRAVGSSEYLTMQNYNDEFIGMGVVAKPKLSMPDFTKRNLGDVKEAIKHSGFTQQALGDDEETELTGTANKVSGKLSGDFNVADNLAVGRLIEVPLTFGEHNISMIVSAEISPIVVPTNNLVDIAKFNGTDRSWLARWHDVRSGRIRLIKDWILCLDLIEMDERALKADSTGSLLAIRSRRTKNIFAALLSGRASPNAISSVEVLTQSTATQMEVAQGGRFSNGRYRDKYFANNSLAMIVIIDPARERGVIYHRGIEAPTMFTLDDIKNNNRDKNGLDMGAMIQAYKLGNAVTL